MWTPIDRRHPAGDWTAGIPACNVAFFSDVKRLDSRKLFRVEATLMQAGMPAIQSLGFIFALQFWLLGQGKFPQHSILFFVENIPPVGHTPESFKFPTAGCEFIKERHGMA